MRSASADQRSKDDEDQRRRVPEKSIELIKVTATRIMTAAIKA